MVSSKKLTLKQLNLTQCYLYWYCLQKCRFVLRALTSTWPGVASGRWAPASAPPSQPASSASSDYSPLFSSGPGTEVLWGLRSIMSTSLFVNDTRTFKCSGKGDTHHTAGSPLACRAWKAEPEKQGELSQHALICMHIPPAIRLHNSSADSELAY